MAFFAQNSPSPTQLWQPSAPLTPSPVLAPDSAYGRDAAHTLHTAHAPHHAPAHAHALSHSRPLSLDDLAALHDDQEHRDDRDDCDQAALLPAAHDYRFAGIAGKLLSLRSAATRAQRTHSLPSAPPWPRLLPSSLTSPEHSSLDDSIGARPRERSGAAGLRSVQALPAVGHSHHHHHYPSHHHHYHFRSNQHHHHHLLLHQRRRRRHTSDVTLLDSPTDRSSSPALSSTQPRGGLRDAENLFRPVAGSTRKLARSFSIVKPSLHLESQPAAKPALGDRKMHQTSSRLLRMTDDDRPFERVCCL